GVCTHSVGDRLDEGGTATAVGTLQRLGHHGVAGEHVVTVDSHRGHAEAATTAGERHAGLPRGRLRDRPVVVLAEEHHRCVVDGGEGQRLVHVALGGGTVAEIGNRGAVATGVSGTDVTVALDAHGIPGGVQRVRADHQGVKVEVVGCRV